MDRSQEVIRNQASNSEEMKSSYGNKIYKTRTIAEEKRLPWLQSSNLTQVVKGLPQIQKMLQNINQGNLVPFVTTAFGYWLPNVFQLHMKDGTFEGVSIHVSIVSN